MLKQTKTIEIDLEVYRVIETNRSSFDETENEILRRLLGLQALENQRAVRRGLNLGYGVILPDGTILKAVYKRVEYQGEIRDGWILINGKRYNSPSGAAKKFGGPNGWTFWKWIKRPQDSEWVVLNQLRNKELIIKKRHSWKGLINLSKEELAEFD